MNPTYTEKITITYEGRNYSGTFRVIAGEVAVFHHLATKRAPIEPYPPALLAKQLLFEIVVRAGLGVPDHEAPNQD